MMGVFDCFGENEIKEIKRRKEYNDTDINTLARLLWKNTEGIISNVGRVIGGLPQEIEEKVLNVALTMRHESTNENFVQIAAKITIIIYYLYY